MRTPLSPPRVHGFRVVTAMPEGFRRPERSDWADLNLHGRRVDCFLEGPCVDRSGALYVTDIPFGRIFRVDRAGSWSQVAEYDGWPNGMKVLDDGRLLVADHRRGLVVVDPSTGGVVTRFADFEGRPFLGLNDLTLSAAGDVYVTDQGQSGLHDPSGRVFRCSADGPLVPVLSGIPSPNGLVLSSDERTLFLAVTRANAIWRVPLTSDGGVTKVGLFIQLSGGVGPDGLAALPDGGLLVVHAGVGVWRFDAAGTPTDLWYDPRFSYPTNLARAPASADRYWVTESLTGTILEIDTGTSPNEGSAHP